MRTSRLPLGLDCDVLVVGAGPVGLATALQAHDHGARVRVVERRSRAFRPSRAMIVHPRVLESLRPLGVSEQVLERGDTRPAAQLHLRRHQVQVRLDDVALPDTPYPHLTLVRQRAVEEVLEEALSRRGVPVERGVELVDVASTPHRATAWLRDEHGVHGTEQRYVAGCDGAESVVRRRAGIAWAGGTYREAVVLADVELDGELDGERSGALHVAAARRGLVFVLALGETATWRVLATRPATPGAVPGRSAPGPGAEQLQELLVGAGLDVRVREVRWSAQVALQHRLAGAFRSGRLFLAGDAAHTHSPAAAQGMNTGLLDAVNLGWKLAFAATSPHGRALLKSYEAERRPVARLVLALTHAVFHAEASTSPLPSLLRGVLVPRSAPALPLLVERPALMALVVKVLSQRWVSYRSSPLSVSGRRGGPGPAPGDRVPDAEVVHCGRTTRLHDLLADPGIHVLGARDADLGTLLDDPAAPPHVHVSRVETWPGCGVLAVRPDGHVGYRSGDDDAGPLRHWLARVGAG